MPHDSTAQAQPSVDRALVVGGGPAGLAAAVSLAHRGVVVELAEITPDRSALGSELMIGQPMLRTLEELGVDQECIGAGITGTNVTLDFAGGAQPMSVPLPGTDPTSSRPPGIGISRARLHAILSEAATAAGVRIQHGLTATQIEQDDRRVRVELSDGTTRDYGLVVGADGLWSRVRELVYPDAPPPQRTGQAVWRVRLPESFERPDDVVTFVYGPDRRKAGIIVTGDHEVYLAMIEPAVDQGERLDDKALDSLLRDRLAQFTGIIGAARDQISTGMRVRYDVLHRIFVPEPWHRGRVVLIGDAAHAMAPHVAYGAGLAVEDGYVLGVEVGESDSLERALQAFGRRRLERCSVVCELCHQIADGELNPSPDFNPGALMAGAWQAVADPA